MLDLCSGCLDSVRSCVALASKGPMQNTKEGWRSWTLNLHVMCIQSIVNSSRSGATSSMMLWFTLTLCAGVSLVRRAW